MPTDPREFALAIAAACLDKKALDVVVLEVGATVSYTDYLVLCSGRSDRQVRAIAEGVGRALRDRPQPVRPLGVEGERGGRWVLMDFGDTILHVFQQDARAFYDLERLWFDAPRLDPESGEVLPEPTAAFAAAPV